MSALTPPPPPPPGAAGVAIEGVSQLSGIPRVAEILDATRHIKTARMTIPVDPDFAEQRDSLETFAHRLEFCSMMMLVHTYSIEYEPEAAVHQGIHPVATRRTDRCMACIQALLDRPGTWDVGSEGEASNTVLRIRLNVRTMRRRGMSASDVGRILRETYGRDVHVACSPSHELQSVLRVRAMRLTDQAASPMRYAHILNSTIVGGLKNVTISEPIAEDTVMQTADGALTVETASCIETAGSCLAAIMWTPHIDWNSTVSNDVMDVYDTLGIAAARVVIFHELKRIISEDGSKVNDRHMWIVALTMTQHGVVMPMSRHGINRIAKTGPLLRCSFEETSDVLIEAGAFTESDTMQGVSQCVMTGQRAFMGTGCSRIMMDGVADGASTNPAATASVSPNEGAMVQSQFSGASLWGPDASAAGTFEPPYEEDADNNTNGAFLEQPFPLHEGASHLAADVDEDIGGAVPFTVHRSLAMARLEAMSFHIPPTC